MSERHGSVSAAGGVESGEENALQVVTTEDGVLLLGDEAALSVLDSSAPQARRLSPDAVNRASATLSTVARWQAEAGRWLRMDDHSAEFVKSHDVGTVRAGVLRLGDIRQAGNQGEIVKHLRFDNRAVLSPASTAGLAGLAAQQAIAASLQEIRDYLAAIDAKLDDLLKQRKIDALGELGGISLAIDEAEAIYAATGTVSEVTWSKIQGASLALQTIQATTLAQLGSLAEDIGRRAGDADRSAEILRKAGDDGPFWLGVLARTMSLQDRQYLLELTRLASADPEELEAHRRGIRAARAERALKIANRLDAVRASARRAAELSNLARVANPFSSQRVTASAAEIDASIADFAAHASLEVQRWSEVDRRSWGDAVKGLVADTRLQAGAAGHEVAGRFGSVGAGLRQRRENALLRRAEQIKVRRGGGEGPGPEFPSEAVSPPPKPSFAEDRGVDGE